jgi:Uma2 family endonuclease
MVVSAKTFEQLALEDSDNVWEMVCGQPRKKPGMTSNHNDVIEALGVALSTQLDRAQYRVRFNSGHLRRTPQNYFVPDVFVLPTAMREPFRDRQVLEIYDGPLPLVAEVWSPSTGDYDVETKLVEYQKRGDREIWLVHPFERTLRAWRRQPDGTYTKAFFDSGSIQPIAFPRVTIELATLFD